MYNFLVLFIFQEPVQEFFFFERLRLRQLFFFQAAPAPRGQNMLLRLPSPDTNQVLQSTNSKLTQCVCVCTKHTILRLLIQLISYKRYTRSLETIYLSLVLTGSCEYLFHEIPGIKSSSPIPKIIQILTQFILFSFYSNKSSRGAV